MQSYDELVKTRAVRAETIRARRLAEIEAARREALERLPNDVSAELYRDEEVVWRREAGERVVEMIAFLSEHSTLKMLHVAGRSLFEKWREKRALLLVSKMGISSKYSSPRTMITYYLALDRKDHNHTLVRDERLLIRCSRDGEYYSEFADVSETISMSYRWGMGGPEIEKIPTDDLRLIHDALVTLTEKTKRVSRCR